MEQLHQFLNGLAPEVFNYRFISFAFIASLATAPLLGLLGPVVLGQRLAFFSTSLGHGALTGLALGLLLWGNPESAWIGLLLFCLAQGWLMNWVRRNTRLPGDTVMGVFMALAVGLGICLLVTVTKRFNIHQIEGLLFGSLITLGPRDLYLLLGLFLVGVPLLAWLYNGLALKTLHPDLPAGRYREATRDYLFITLLTLVVVANLKLMGAYLVEALIVLPAASARNISHSLKAMAWFSVLFALLSLWGGLALSILFPLPPGAATVAVLALFFFGTLSISIISK